MPESSSPSVDFIAKVANGIDRLVRPFDGFANLCSLLLVVLGLLNVGLSLLGRGLGVSLVGNATLEGQWYLFGLSFLFGMAGTLQEDRHVRVDVLSSYLSKRARTGLERAGFLFLLLPFCAYAVWSTLPMVERSLEVWETSSDPGGLPRWPLKLVVPFGFGLLLIQGIGTFVRSFAPMKAAPEQEGRQ